MRDESKEGTGKKEREENKEDAVLKKYERRKTFIILIVKYYQLFSAVDGLIVSLLHVALLQN